MAEVPHVAVLGAGSFGRNHLRVYRDLPSAHLAAIVDSDEATRAKLAAEYGIPAFATVDDLLASGLRIDAASVCVPTVHHAAVANKLLSAGIDVLIEKPIASTLEEADSILATAAAHKRIVQVGHLERFNPAVTASYALLNQPMFFEAHRLSIFTPRSLDVDVVLDLMIHDLDIVLSLVQSPVKEVRAVGLPVLSRKTDIANVRVEFENGCVANFTASRISTERVRKLRFFQPHQYLSLDFARQDLFLIDVTAAASLTPEQLTALFSQMQQRAAADEPGNNLQHPTPGLNLRQVNTVQGEPLRLELESFLESIRARTAPRVTGEEARAALALALQINAAIAGHASRAGLL